MKKLILAFSLIAISSLAHSQAIFLDGGKIEFERKTNVHRLYLDWTNEDGTESSFMEQFKKAIPQFRTDYFELIFADNKTVYRQSRESADANKFGFFGQGVASTNVVYKDLEQQLFTSQKQVFEDQLLISDTLSPIQWKLQSETRTIAGFECRKAVGRICDSVVVVAFYTEEILATSGPESFHGLPGMILGIAIPRLYTTWFATKVEMLGSGDQAKISPPSKGKKLDEEEMYKRLYDGIKRWDEKYRNKNLWLVSL